MENLNIPGWCAVEYTVLFGVSRRKDHLAVLIPLNEQDPVTDLLAAGRIQAEPAVKGKTVELRGSGKQVVILQRTGMSHALLEDQTRSKTAGSAVFRLASTLLLRIARKPDSVRPRSVGEFARTSDWRGPMTPTAARPSWSWKAWTHAATAART